MSHHRDESVSPLEGQRVLVTRAPEQAEPLVSALAARGAKPIALATIAIGPPDDWAPCDNAIATLATYEMVFFTSANGVHAFFNRMHQIRGVPNGPIAPDIVAIGSATAATLQAYESPPTIVPSTATSAAIVDALQDKHLRGRRVLVARAREGREDLVNGLIALGAVVDDVPVYRTRLAGDPTEARRLLSERRIDVITFTSGSTVRGLLALLGEPALPRGMLVACIGPSTADVARKAGIAVDVVATDQSVNGLVDAIEAALRARRTEV